MLECLAPRNSQLSSNEKELYKKISNLGDDDLRRYILESPVNLGEE